MLPLTLFSPPASTLCMCDWFFLFAVQKLLQNAKVLQALQQQFRLSADVRSLKTLLVRDLM